MADQSRVDGETGSNVDDEKPLDDGYRHWQRIRIVRVHKQTFELLSSDSQRD